MHSNKIPSAIFGRMGLELTIKKGAQTVNTFYGLLQPLRYKNKIYLKGVATELGYDSLKKYLLLSPADIDLSDVDGTEVSLYLGNMHLSIDHTEKVYFAAEPYYTWSIVSKEE